MKKIFLIFLISIITNNNAILFAENHNKQLFVKTDNSKVLLKGEEKEQLNNILNRTTTKNVKLFEINEEIDLLQEEIIKINLPDGIKGIFHKDKIKLLNENEFVWFGSNSDDAYGSAILVIDNASITGTIRLYNKLYKIEPIKRGIHAVILNNKAGLPPEHPPEFPEGTLHKTQNNIKQKIKSSISVNKKSFSSESDPIIDILVAYTPSAANAHGDISSLIQTAISETNMSYSNSNIGLTINLIYSVQVNYTESGSFSTDLNRFKNTFGIFGLDELVTFVTVVSI